MDQYQLIRHQFAVEGASQRQIARELGISRNTVKKYCQGAEVPWTRKTPRRTASVLTPEVLEFIQACFDEDEEAPPKQCHTARRIHERLRDELGFAGAESTVRHQVAQMRAKMPEVYIPLAFDPGEAVQVDWGEATVEIAGRRQVVHLLCMRLCFSCVPFVVAFPSEREEAFFEGHQLGFEYFGGVPRIGFYDNLKTAVKEGWGRTAREQQQFSMFRAHYAYEARFCNIAEGHEKGLVESLVGWIRRNALVPVPKVKDFDELNRVLLNRCETYLQHRIHGRPNSVGQDFAVERNNLLALPLRPFECARLKESKVSEFATVAFDGNRYSVPVELAGQIVTVKGSGYQVRIFCRETEVARHERCYEKGRTLFELSHYIRLLEKRPRAVAHARPVREARLPALFWEYARTFPDPEATMVQLLRLVVDHGVEAVQQAVERTQALDLRSIEVVGHYTRVDQAPRIAASNAFPVNLPDLGRYDDLLVGGAGR